MPSWADVTAGCCMIRASAGAPLADMPADMRHAALWAHLHVLCLRCRYWLGLSVPPREYTALLLAGSQGCCSMHALCDMAVITPVS